jgi:hypothetical protein
VATPLALYRPEESMNRVFYKKVLCSGLLLALLVLTAPPVQACSVPHAAAPHGRLIREPLRACDEMLLLQPRGEPLLYAVAAPDGNYREEREAALLIHGLGGHPADLSELAGRLSDADYQVYVLFFDDMGRRARDNGKGLAGEIGALSKRLGPGRDLTVIAHSAGGLVARHALNLLSHSGELGRFAGVHFYAIDTPWHGYFGPSDRTFLGKLRMSIARPFLPDGIEDLRAESELFIGEPRSDHAVLRLGLLRYPLAANVRVHLYFAQEGDEVHDYTEGVLVQLSERIVAYYKTHTPLRGDPRLQNFWHALISTHGYFAFQEELRGLADAGRLDPDAVRRALLRYFPKLSGDHSGVLSARQSSGAGTLFSQLRHMKSRLNCPGHMSLAMSPKNTENRSTPWWATTTVV